VWRIRVICLLLKYTAVAGVYPTKKQKVISWPNSWAYIANLLNVSLYRKWRASIILLLRYNRAHNYYNTLFIIHNFHTYSNDIVDMIPYSVYIPYFKYYLPNLDSVGQIILLWREVGGMASLFDLYRYHLWS